MNIKKIPAEVALALTGLLARLITSVLTSAVVVFTIWVFLPASYLIVAFIGAIIAQVVLRGFDKEVRKDAKVVWWWLKEKSDNFPKWAYSSKRDKDNMDFMNFVEGRGTDAAAGSPPTKKTTADNLKESANRSLLDD